MPDSIKKVAILFALVAILASSVYIFLNLTPTPTGQITLPIEASFSSVDADGDVNQDGEIDIFDVVSVIQNKGKADFNPRTDVNKDGKVDDADVEIVKSQMT